MAAGQSARFGDNDKLTQDLGGIMLGLHAAETFAGMGFATKTIICSSEDHPCSARWQELGYQIVVNENAKDGQASSLAVGVKAAQASNASAICITLADMPFVTRAHIEKLIEEHGEEHPIVASCKSGISMPPAIFGKEYASVLMAQKGDKGAKGLLKGARAIEAEGPCLLDIDTPQKLTEYQIYAR